MTSAKLLSINIFLSIALFINGCSSPAVTHIPADKAKTAVVKEQSLFPFKRVNKQMDKLPSTIRVEYGHVACPCAQWMIKIGKADEYIYVEPANTQLKVAEGFATGDYWGINLELTGRFYKEKGYPNGYDPGKGEPDSARVFRYTKLKIIKLFSLKKKRWVTTDTK